MADANTINVQDKELRWLTEVQRYVGFREAEVASNLLFQRFLYRN